MMVPTIHLNGTGSKALLEQLRDASDALDAALKAMGEAYPHGRDYYPQGQEAIYRATAEADKRLVAVRTVKDELDALALAVYDLLPVK